MWLAQRADSRIDFRDISVTVSYFSPATAQALENIARMWRFSAYDESTCVALLDIHVAHGLESWFTKDDLVFKNKTFESADACAEDIRLKYPQAMRSRPYFRWILLKSAELGCRSLRGLTDPYSALEQNFREFPGLTIHHRGIISSYYVPRYSENPGWSLPEAPTQPNAPLHAVVKAAEQLQDLATQALAYRLLAWRSASPFQMFQKLSILQKDVQGDSRGRLETLLSSYLACEGRPSREWLLTELKDTDEWTGDLELRDPLLYFARDFIQRAIERSLYGVQAAMALRTKDCRYYQWLIDPLQRFIDESTARNCGPRRSSTLVELGDHRFGESIRYGKGRQQEEVLYGIGLEPRGRFVGKRRHEEARGVKFDVASQNAKINSRRSTTEFSTRGDMPDFVESVSRSRKNAPSSEIDTIFVDVEGTDHGTHSHLP